MKINLFEGRNIYDYLLMKKGHIDTHIKMLKQSNFSDTDIRERVIKEFYIEPINIIYSEAKINELHILGKEEQPVDGYPSMVEVYAHSFEVPYTGERDLLSCMPKIYSGLRNRAVQIIDGKIYSVFKARRNFQPQIDHFSLETHGDSYENQMAINEVVAKWNESLKSYV